MCVAFAVFSLLWWRCLPGYQSEIVGNKAERRISNGCFKKTKHVKFSEKTNIFYSLIHTRTFAYQRVKNVRFSENLTCFVFLKHPFWDSPFYLLTDEICDNFKYLVEFSWKKEKKATYYSQWMLNHLSVNPTYGQTNSNNWAFYEAEA